jgi:AcrR family transcriptional regulator
MNSVKSMSGKNLGRRPGNENTKAKIIGAAQICFAQHGYDRAPLRQVATLAQVDPALILHYFGTKQQLFIEAMLPLFEGPKMLPAAMRGDASGIGTRLATLFIKLTSEPTVQQLMLGLFKSVSSERQAAVLLSEFVRTNVIEQLEPYLPGPNKKLQANIIGSQLVGIFMARYVIKVEPIASTTDSEVIEYLAPRLQAHFV